MFRELELEHLVIKLESNIEILENEIEEYKDKIKRINNLRLNDLESLNSSKNQIALLLSLLTKFNTLTEKANDKLQCNKFSHIFEKLYDHSLFSKTIINENFLSINPSIRYIETEKLLREAIEILKHQPTDLAIWHDRKMKLFNDYEKIIGV